jgi:penicillin-binding protein 1A
VVFPDGKTDVTTSSDGKRVLTPGQAYEVTKILEGVITQGTGAGYTDIGSGCSGGEAGKTGTSEGESDAWFVGYTTKYSTAVWTGHPLSRDYTGFGGPTSGPIWRAYMQAATGGTCETFPVPSSLPTLSAYHGPHTASAPSKYGGSTSSGSSTYSYPSTTTTTPTAPTTTTPTTGTSGSSGSYPPNLYAPGAGQQPLPSPGGGGTGAP